MKWRFVPCYEFSLVSVCLILIHLWPKQRLYISKGLWGQPCCVNLTSPVSTSAEVDGAKIKVRAGDAHTILSPAYFHSFPYFSFSWADGISPLLVMWSGSIFLVPAQLSSDKVSSGTWSPLAPRLFSSCPIVGSTAYIRLLSASPTSQWPLFLFVFLLYLYCRLLRAGSHFLYLPMSHLASAISLHHLLRYGGGRGWGMQEEQLSLPQLLLGIKECSEMVCAVLDPGHLDLLWMFQYVLSWGHGKQSLKWILSCDQVCFRHQHWKSPGRQASSEDFLFAALLFLSCLDAFFPLWSLLPIMLQS